MKTLSVSSIRLPVLAGALALVLTGCGSTGGFMNRSADSSSNRSADSSTNRDGSMNRSADGTMNRDGTMHRGADGTMHRSTGEVYGPMGYVGQSGATAGIPPSIDPFSRSYVPFPVSANESAGIIGHSVFCVEHYNQPGCQTMDSTRDSRGMGMGRSRR